ncbi:MAG: HD domain-containing protein [Legionella sp.]|nr:MAG: HD domain-containing protein [Legionella sp.]
MDFLFQRFTNAGQADYIGEPISQIEHSLQCAYFAEKAGHSEEVILASLLHDIGHFFPNTEQYKMADLGTVHHEWIGAKLAYDLHFSPKVALLIGHHVDAKRYLAAKKSNYYTRLSLASQQTLSYQGGPMLQEELQTFEQLPLFKEILQVRINDEKSKEIDLEVPDLAYYLPMIQQHMHNQQRKEIEPLTDFVDKHWVKQLKLQLYTKL